MKKQPRRTPTPRKKRPVTTPDHSRQGSDEGAPPESMPRAIPAVAIIHQEGAIALIAVVALSFRDGGLLGGLRSPVSLLTAVVLGLGVGAASFALLWLARGVGPLHALETWQRGMVKGWGPLDIAAVAVVSGLAEEALVRALLQPILGLIPAALLFAVLHVVPDRRLWLWPMLAFVLGVVLGLVFEYAGYPAAAAAHIAINGLSLSRLREPENVE